VGNPRSGTTFLHRLLAKDEDRFSTMKMWEILFAPSVSQRRLVQALVSLEDRLGRPVQRWLAAVEKRWHRKNVMHKVSLRMPEEDEYLLLHIWSALTAGLSAGVLQEAIPYTYFDQMLPPRQRRRILHFYKACVQRHLYAHCEENRRQYLAKNPALCPKVGTVLEHFPQARIIYLVRSPLEMVPSYTHMMEFTWRIIGIARDGSELHDYLLDMAEYWYTHPLEELEGQPPDRYCVVRYDDLVANPEKTITEIYQTFGLQMSPHFAQVLREEAEKARSFKPRHKYSAEQLGLDRQQIVERCAPIFERFGFDREE
jgi:omega-hydroxy-beta-dihydromenaquinone-9 sulfotransferase